ncbi:AraC family transcriptional regulator [Saccharospirillum sp. MSK14-1]|uniref:helix-turn-helix domain-containing protein n=1 Tax=Saccharospirillum sp. MSK14-1 TaxID=1897632 RepID=UPI000D39616D|nr:AraC family transcriptional regulator [Saccharospirillum sp. MSK14-1]PTY38253.1 AraC family transcriptional regulator [Saccharospirillum sp. MSK14-1]
MATNIRVTGAWVQLLSDWLDQENLPAPELRAVLDSRGPADIVALPLWRELLASAVALRPQQPAPGLAIGGLVQPRHLGVLGYLTLTCQTLGEAMLAYQRYESLFYGQDLVEVLSEGSVINLRWPASASVGDLADSVSIAALIRFMRRLASQPPSLTDVSFVFPAPTQEAHQAYEDFFGCPVHFDASHTSVRFPQSLLSIRLPHNDTSLRALLDQQAQALLQALPDSDPFDRALQHTMVRLLPEGQVSLKRVAAQLHVSVRTLQRRLEQRQLTWRSLLDRTREQLAHHYLADASLTLSEIALLLGYSEHSAFSRAYRQWTGHTPAQARQSNNRRE